MRPSKVRYREVWSTCYWCRQNFCTMRAWFPGIRGHRKAPFFCGYKCESLSRRWDHICASGLTSSKYGYGMRFSLHSLTFYPCGHERTPANTRTYSGKKRCKPCFYEYVQARHRKKVA